MKKSALFVFVVVAASVCSGQWLERTVAVGDTVGFKLQGGIVVNPVSGNVYIEGDPTRVFDPATAAKVTTFNAAGPVVFCPASSKGYIIGGSALIIDAGADTVLGTVALPFKPAALAYSATSNRLYLESPNDTGPLVVFDPAGDSVVGKVEIGYPTAALLWDSAQNRLYVGTRSGSGLVKVVDCASDTVLADIHVDLDEVSLLALSTVSSKLYCAGVPDSTGGSNVVVVSTDSLVPVASVPGLPSLATAVYSPVADRLCCLDSRGDTLYVIDCAGDSVRSRLGAKFSSVAVSTINGEVYLGQRRVRPILVLDTTGVVVDSIPCPATTSNNVGAVAFNPARGEVYASLTDDLAYMADAATGSVTGVFDYVAYTPYQMVYNPNGGKLYLFCPSENAVLVMDSTFTTRAFIYNGVTSSNAFPVLDSARNRIYVADNQVLRVLDCYSDSLVSMLPIPGIDHPVSVLVPGVSKLFVFNSYGTGDSVYAYDCAGGGVQRVLHLSAAAPSAVFDPRSNRVFFLCQDQPILRALDPVTGSVVREFEFGPGCTRGRLAVDPDLGRLYLTEQDMDRLYTIGVDNDSLMGYTQLSWHIDSLVFNRRLGKLYLCSRSQPSVLAFSCSQDTVVHTIFAGFHFSALMNDSNDKLYLRYGAVANCRFDFIVKQLDNINPRAMAWDKTDNRVFEAELHRLYVYRDDPTGVEETRVGELGPMLTVVGNPVHDAIRLRLQIPSGRTGVLRLLDAAGRVVSTASVMRPSSFNLDLRSVPAGVYFVCLDVGRIRATDKVIVQR